jgi:hypothetical protein
MMINPLAILLSYLPHSSEEQMEEIGFFYQDLNRKGFYKGNNLQTISHIFAYCEHAAKVYPG